MLKVTLQNEFLGSTSTMVAIGLNELVQDIKRGEDSDGIFYRLIINIQFIKDAREYLKKADENYGGIDALVNVLVELENPNTAKFEEYYIGTVDFNLSSIEEDRMAVNITEGDGFQELVMNGLKTVVNLETLTSADGASLPSMRTIPSLPLHSKTIKKTLQQNRAIEETEYLNTASGSGALYNVLNLFNFVNDLNNAKNYGDGWFDVKPETDRLFIFKVEPDDVGSWDLKMKFRVKGVAGDLSYPPGSLTPIRLQLKFFISVRKSNGSVVDINQLVFNQISAVSVGIDTGFIDVNVLYNVNLEQGDEVYFYPEVIYIPYSNDNFFKLVFDLGAENYFSAVGLTTFPSSTCKSVLIYEAVKKCVQYLTGQSDCFKSDLLGRTDLGYAEDGQASLLAITNGKLIRVSRVVTITRSGDLTSDLKYLLDFLNSVYCIGWGFETIDGVLKFVVEKKSYWYDREVKCIDLGRVGPVIATRDKAAFYSKFIFGYSTKLENNETNSMDEFNTLRTYIPPIVNTKNELDVSTDMKVSGYQIEQQRRLIASSKDSKLDDSLFAICVVRDGDNFKSQSNEGYASITNVFDAPTGYNYNISPRRILENWLPALACITIRSFSKIVKFSSGQTNYLMTSRKDTETVDMVENENVDLTYIQPIYDPNALYKINEAALSRDQVILLKANPKAYVSIQDRFGFTMKGYVSKKGIEHDSNKGTAALELIKWI